MEKIYVSTYQDLSEDIFNGNLDTVIENLKNVVKHLEAKGCNDFHFTWFGDYDYQAVRMHFQKLETDAEFKKRERKLSLQLKKGEKNIEKRRKLFEELKKEFEE